MAETTLGEEPVYTLGSDEVERARLRRQSDDLRQHACALPTSRTRVSSFAPVGSPLFLAWSRKP
jgi:hypothetical protein